MQNTAVHVYIYPIIIWLFSRNYFCIFIFCAMLHCPQNGIVTLKHFATQELFIPSRSNSSVTRGRENCGVGGGSSITKAFSVAFTCSCYRKLNKTETDPTFQYHFKTIPKQNASQMSPKKCCTEDAAQAVNIRHPSPTCSFSFYLLHNLPQLHTSHTGKLPG